MALRGTRDLTSRSTLRRDIGADRESKTEQHGGELAGEHRLCDARTHGRLHHEQHHAAVCPARSHAACPSFQRLLRVAAAKALPRRKRFGA